MMPQRNDLNYRLERELVAWFYGLPPDRLDEPMMIYARQRGLGRLLELIEEREPLPICSRCGAEDRVLLCRQCRRNDEARAKREGPVSGPGIG